MLECKYIQHHILLNFKHELIDTCWNVNRLVTLITHGIVSELIDTCWNVNQPVKAMSAASALELIDTCWNVNLELRSLRLRLSRN